MLNQSIFIVLVIFGLLVFGKYRTLWIMEIRNIIMCIKQIEQITFRSIADNAVTNLNFVYNTHFFLHHIQNKDESLYKFQ